MILRRYNAIPANLDKINKQRLAWSLTVEKGLENYAKPDSNA